MTNSKQFILSILLLTLGFSTPVFAQSSNNQIVTELRNIKEVLKDIGGFMVKTTNQTVETTANFFYELDPNMASTVAANQTYSDNDGIAEKTADKHAYSTITKRLNNHYALYKGNNRAYLSKLALDAPASDTFLPDDVRTASGGMGGITSIFSAGTGTGQKKDCLSKLFPNLYNVDSNKFQKYKKNGDNLFNFASLFNSLGYDGEDPECYAKLYIDYFANYKPQLAKDLRDIRGAVMHIANKTDDKATAKDLYQQLWRNDPEIVKKMYTVRSRIAARSVALNNLYKLYGERKRIKGAGNKAGMDQENASPLEIKKHMADKRAGNPEWYKEMSEASPATVNREMLFVMAEMRQQMFQLHMDNERIISALSVMDIAQAGFYDF